MSSLFTKLPEEVDALIDFLDSEAFPLRSLPVDMPYHEMQREMGRRDVVDYLRSLQRERDERALGSPVCDMSADDSGGTDAVWSPL